MWLSRLPPKFGVVWAKVPSSSTSRSMASAGRPVRSVHITRGATSRPSTEAANRKIEGLSFSHSWTRPYEKALGQLCEKLKPSLFLVAASRRGRDMAPRVLGTLRPGLSPDGIELPVAEARPVAAP